MYVCIFCINPTDKKIILQKNALKIFLSSHPFRQSKNLFSSETTRRGRCLFFVLRTSLADCFQHLHIYHFRYYYGIARSQIDKKLKYREITFLLRVAKSKLIDRQNALLLQVRSYLGKHANFRVILLLDLYWQLIVVEVFGIMLSAAKNGFLFARKCAGVQEHPWLNSMTSNCFHVLRISPIWHPRSIISSQASKGEIIVVMEEYFAENYFPDEIKSWRIAGIRVSSWKGITLRKKFFFIHKEVTFHLNY